MNPRRVLIIDDDLALLQALPESLGLRLSEVTVNTAELSPEEAAQEIEYLTHAADELSRLAPEEGEEEALASMRALLMNAGRLAQDIAVALPDLQIAHEAALPLRASSVWHR